MQTSEYTLRFTTLREISELLEHNHHNGFPVFGSHVDTQAYDKGGEGQTHDAERYHACSLPVF